MATNKYFNLHGLSGNNLNEQALVKGFVAESIQIFGLDIEYLPRTLVKEDALFQEDVISSFNSAFSIEAFVETMEGFDGDDLLAQFGLTGKDQVSMMIAQDRFRTITSLPRPMEGDLFHFPLSKTLFEVKFVEHEDQFYPNGTLPSFKLRCEAFDYSGETLSTGVPEVDAVETTLTANDPYANNTNIETEGATILDFSEANPFGTP